jgi:hypothetical protein
VTVTTTDIDPFFDTMPKGDDVAGFDGFEKDLRLGFISVYTLWRTLGVLGK